MNYDDYLKRLNKAYSEFYTEKKGGKPCCANYDRCKASFGDKIPEYEAGFNSDFAARLGRDYDKAKIRTLFVGKEGINYHDTFGEPSENDNNDHYRGTLLAMMKILGEISIEDVDRVEKELIADKKEFKAQKRLAPQLCLTNHFKCAFKQESNENKRSHVLNTAVQKDFCAPLLVKEIEALRPNILIWQGSSHLDRRLWTELEEAYYYQEKLYAYQHGTGAYKYVHKQTGEELYFICTYHPSGANCGKWKKSLPYLFEAIDIVVEMLGNV